MKPLKGRKHIYFFIADYKGSSIVVARFIIFVHAVVSVSRLMTILQVDISFMSKYRLKSNCSYPGLLSSVQLPVVIKLRTYAGFFYIIVISITL